MDNLGAIFSVILIMTTSGFFGSVLGAMYSPANSKAVQAIAECEANLPRNQSCAYVITARVKNKIGDGNVN